MDNINHPRRRMSIGEGDFLSAQQRYHSSQGVRVGIECVCRQIKVARQSRRWQKQSRIVTFNQPLLAAYDAKRLPQHVWLNAEFMSTAPSSDRDKVDWPASFDGVRDNNKWPGSE